MNCPAVVNDLTWGGRSLPNGTQTCSPHFLVQVPENMGSNNVNFNTNRQWTNVRGFGNIVIYNETDTFPIVNFTTHPWNR